MTSGAAAAALRAPRERDHRRRAALEHSAFVLLPALVCLFVAYHEVSSGIGAIDFRLAYRHAALAVLHGRSPYAASSATLASGEAFVYPAPAALLLAPLGLLGTSFSSVLFTLITAAAVPATLYTLRARDWRLYGLALVLPWVVAGWQTANLTLPLVLGTAVVWRNRDRPLVTGLLVALLISLKPFALPLLLWLAATRRWRALTIGTAAAIATNAVSWAVIGFSQIPRYLHDSARLTSLLDRTGYGAISLTSHLGLGVVPGEILLGLLGIGLIVTTIRFARDPDNPRALAASVVLMLAPWPLLWSHYLALLIVPLAVRHPRLDRRWILPLALWACPVREAAAWQVAATWFVAVLLCVDLLARGPHRLQAPLPLRPLGGPA